jgi:hypothetical protein
VAPFGLSSGRRTSLSEADIVPEIFLDVRSPQQERPASAS